MNTTDNAEVDKAFLIILNELRKKDERIKVLEDKVKGLNEQLMIKKQFINGSMPMPMGSSIPKPISIPRQKALDDYNETTLDNLIITNQSKYIVPKMQGGLTSESQRKMYESDTEKRIKTQVTNTTPLDSFIGGVSGVGGKNRNDIKNYLAEVKETIDPKTFKEFIKCIKLLTNKQLVLNKKEVFDKVEMLLGNENKDLYLKFEAILGYRK